MSQFLRKSLAVVAAGLISVSLTYCGKKPNVGTVSVQMTASSGSFESVAMTVSKVEFLESNTDEGTWRILSERRQALELTSLNGGARTLLDKVQVPAGSYKKIRITLADGSVVPAEVTETARAEESEPAAVEATVEATESTETEATESTDTESTETETTEAETTEAESAALPAPASPSVLRSAERGSPLTMTMDHEFSISRHKHYELVLKVDAARGISKTSRGYVLGNSMSVNRFNQAP